MRVGFGAAPVVAGTEPLLGAGGKMVYVFWAAEDSTIRLYVGVQRFLRRLFAHQQRKPDGDEERC